MLEACGSLLVSRFLVFRICDIGDLPVPAVTAALALIALVRGRAGLALSRD